MSWQSYVDSTLVGSGKVAKASIFGLDGSVWAISPDFTISEPEAQKAIAAFTNSSDTFASGTVGGYDCIFLEGSKYTVLRADDQSIYASNGAIGVTIVKTDMTIIVGFYNETMQAGNCNTLVEGFAEFLRNVGYKAKFAYKQYPFMPALGSRGTFNKDYDLDGMLGEGIRRLFYS